MNQGSSSSIRIDPNERVTKYASQYGSKIVQAMMTVPFQYSQICIPGLEQFTEYELRIIYKFLLHSPPHFLMESIGDQPINSEEDFILFLHGAMPKIKKSIGKFDSDIGGVVKPYRSEKTINARKKEILNLPQKELNNFIDQYCRRYLYEKRFYQSMTNAKPSIDIKKPSIEQCKCLVHKPPELNLNPKLRSEIENLMAHVPVMTEHIFSINAIALIRGESSYFEMTSRFITIGRNTETSQANIDLTFCSKRPLCPHVSRQQATIQFMDDGHFYLENVGKGIIRVNGYIIEPRARCQVAPYAILDFFGSLFMFIPNFTLILKIMYEYKKSLTGYSRR